jgi:hypothetical protein
MSTKGYPAPLTWDRLLELAAQGHDHYDAALTSTRARQLVASVNEHFGFTDVDYMAAQACTPEERKVLEAMAAADLGEEDADDAPGEPVEVGEDCYIYTTDQFALVVAELANRAAKAKK